jgi:acyl-CoA thioesterase-2
MNHPPGFAPHDGLQDLLELQAETDDQHVSERLDGNQNGRVFGGQLLAHAVTAAAVAAPERHLSSLRLGFLQGALGGTPLRWQARTLQHGSRYTTRHLRATQGERVIADAQVTLQMPARGFEHTETMPPDVPPPAEVPTLADLEAHIAQVTGQAYSLQMRPFLDVRLIDADRFLLQPAAEPRLRYWVKARDALLDDAGLQAAALAYISDFWLNYASLASHIGITGARDRVYVASLNHALWCYGPCRADEWLLFDVTSPIAADGRGLAWARVFTPDGRLVACATQEMVCSVKDL